MAPAQKVDSFDELMALSRPANALEDPTPPAVDHSAADASQSNTRASSSQTFQILDSSQGTDLLQVAHTIASPSAKGVPKPVTKELIQAPAKLKPGRPKGVKNQPGHKAGGYRGPRQAIGTNRLQKGAQRPEHWKKTGPKVGSHKKAGSRIVTPLTPGYKRPDHW